MLSKESQKSRQGKSEGRGNKQAGEISRQGKSAGRGNKQAGEISRQGKSVFCKALFHY